MAQNKGQAVATIKERVNSDGSLTFRVLIRRKNVPSLCLSFCTEKEAIEWVNHNEMEYIRNPLPYLKWISKERLKMQRARCFSRTKAL